jgi:hypothetical protein
MKWFGNRPDGRRGPLRQRSALVGVDGCLVPPINQAVSSVVEDQRG